MRPRAADRRGLRHGEVHVWLAPLVEDEERTAGLLPLLDRDEAARAARFSYAPLRMHFVQSHGVARRILAEYAGADPADLVFARGRHGKPRLVAPAAASRLQFSLSHSGDCCVLAVRRGRPVGVDIERRREMPRALDIARRNFTAPEIQMLARLPGGSAQREGFFALWTRKEAATKAMGASLAESLKRLECGFDANGRANGRVRLAALNGDRPRARRWAVLDLDLGPDYAAALATALPVRDLQQFAWNEATPAAAALHHRINVATAAKANVRWSSFLK